MRSFLPIFAFLFLQLLTAQAQERPYVILISFDGFRHDYVERYDLPNFKAFVEKGSQAKALIPSFPSKTFPNHYTLVTGLYPGHHGLVDNSFYDAEKKETFGMRNKDRATNPYYYGGVSLWQLAKQHHVKSASYFWVGSEQTLEERQPDYFFPYNERFPFEKRVDQALDWLKLPENERPHLITLYFSSPDHESHTYGPVSHETKQAVMRSDTLLGRLMTGLRDIPLPVNVVLVSDHGMKEIEYKEETYLFVNELCPQPSAHFKIVNNGTLAHVYADNAVTRDSIFALLKKESTKKSSRFTVVKREDFPAQWNYTHERCGDFLILAKPGYYILNATRKEFLAQSQVSDKAGVHGYDPATTEDMRGIFYAQGPNIRSGVTIAPFENIHVFPFIALLLNLELPPIDGRREVLDKIYVKP